MIACRRAANPGVSLALAANRLGDDLALLDGIVTDGTGLARQQRVQELRLRLAAVCQARVQRGLDEQIVAPLLAGVSGDGAVQAMEYAARDLRQLATVGRQLRDGDPSNALLRDAAARIRNGPAASTLSPVDRARLVEILAGPEAGLEVLHEATAACPVQPASGEPTEARLLI